jgi:hypothetical protein
MLHPIDGFDRMSRPAILLALYPDDHGGHHGRKRPAESIKGKMLPVA